MTGLAATRALMRLLTAAMMMLALPCVFLTALVIGTFTSRHSYAAVLPITTPNPEGPAIPVTAAGPRMTFLVMGVDLRPGESGPANTDTLMLFSLDLRTGDAAMLSIPRDLWVEIPGYGENRINAAYAVGETVERGGGPALAMQTVENALGIHSDHWAILRFEAVPQVVDLIGGIDVDVPFDIYDPAYPTPDYGTEVFSLSAGKQHLDGETALKYMRTRHQDSDFGRMDRQRQVISAIREKAGDPATFGGLLPRLPGFLLNIRQDFSTDLAPGQVLLLARIMALSGQGAPRSLAIDSTAVVPWTTPNGGQVLLPADPERIADIAREFLASNP